MKSKIILIVVCVVFLLKVKAQNNSYVSMNSLGTYFFNYAGYKFNKPYKHSLLSFNYSRIKNKKNGYEIELNYFSIPYKFPSVFPALYIRNGLFLNVSYLNNFLHNNKIDLYYSIGLSTKYSTDDIFESSYNMGAWNEITSDLYASEIGGLAINLGLNSKIFLSKRLYINTSIKTVNFPLRMKYIGAKYQTNTIFTQLGMGIMLGKK